MLSHVLLVLSRVALVLSRVVPVLCFCRVAIVLSCVVSCYPVLSRVVVHVIFLTRSENS